MKKAFIIILSMMGSYCSIAQDSLTYSSVIVYKLKPFNIIIVSTSPTDLELSKQDSLQQSPSRNRHVTIHGPFCKIFITTNEEPFLYPVRNLSFYKDEKNSSPILPDELEIRSGVTNYGSTEWMDVKSFPLLKSDLPISLLPIVPGNLPVTKGNYYTVYERAVIPYTERIVNFRNKTTKEEILNITFKVVDSPIRPALAFALQNNANQNLVDSLLRRSSQAIEVPDLTEFLNKTGSKFPGKSFATPMQLQDDSLFNTSELILYFTRQRSEYPDSSLEYRLSDESNTETAWTKSGHKLIISDLKTGSHYALQVRYELHPAFIQKYTFYVVPKWYQSKQFKILCIGLLISIALIAALLIYYNLSRKNRRRRQQLSLELRSIRSQLNPHFIFNALSSIQSLMNKNDISAANLYLTSFSTLLRDSLKNNEKEMVPLATEINLLEVYLKLEQLRFSFKFEVNVHESIDKNATEIPNLLIQPLVENAVKHGVSTLSEKGFINIEFIKREYDLIILVRDNGDMFDEKQSKPGFGLKLTRSRIALLNQTLKKQPVYLTLERSNDGKTIANLLLTNWF